MHKFYLFAAGLLLASSSAFAAEPVFSVNMNAESAFSEADFAAWTVVDSNEDGKTWVFAGDALPSKVYYSYHGSNAGDDWLISPSITVPEAGSYLVRFTCTGSSYGEALEVYYGAQASIEGMTTKAAENLDIKGDPTSGYFIADFNAGEEFFIGFHAVTPADRFRLYLNSVTVSPISNPVDLGVTEIISPVSGEGLGQETVTVSVKNFLTTDANGFDIYYSIDGSEPVAEHVDAVLKGGETMQYTFTAKADCSTPRGKYTLKAYTADPNDVAPDNDAQTVVVRHIAPAGVPYANGFEPDDDCSNFTYLNLNEDDGDWTVGVNGFFSSFSRTGEGYLAYNYNKENAADDWVFIDPLQIEAGDYLLRFWYSATTNHTERLKVCWGTAPTPEAMTNEICKIDPMTNDEYEESINIFNIPENQKVFIGFYAYSDADENWMIIDDLSIEKVDPTKVDLIVGEITEPCDYLRKNNHRDIVASVRNVSVSDANAAVKLYINGEEKASENITVGYMATKEVKFTGCLDGLTDGTYTIKIEAVADNDNNTDNNVAEKNITIIEQEPILLYDFEDEEWPEELTYRVEDSATINPAAQDSFGERGAAFFGVESHYLYGNTVLALCTWFADASSSADRWIVLPQMHLNDANCHLVWDASAFSTTDYEKYDICVSTSEDIWYNYTTVYSVTSENEWAKTRGVSLADYADKDVYIAFHLKTQNGNALILDNIGLYGSATTGVEGIAAESEMTFGCNGDLLVSNVDATMTVTSINGVIVATGNGTTLNIANLPAGMYIAKAAAAEGTRTIKFVKK